MAQFMLKRNALLSVDDSQMTRKSVNSNWEISRVIRECTERFAVELIGIFRSLI
jgi:hypothetical protein